MSSGWFTVHTKTPMPSACARRHEARRDDADRALPLRKHGGVARGRREPAAQAELAEEHIRPEFVLIRAPPARLPARRFHLLALESADQDPLPPRIPAQPVPQRVSRRRGLDLGHDRQVAQRLEHLLEGGDPDPLSAEGERLPSVRGEAVPGVESLQFVQRPVFHRPGPSRWCEGDSGRG